MASEIDWSLAARLAEAFLGYERWTCLDYDFREAVLMPPGTNMNHWRKVGPEVPLAESGAVRCPLPFLHDDAAIQLARALAARYGRCEVSFLKQGEVVCRVLDRGVDTLALAQRPSLPEAVTAVGVRLLEQEGGGE